VKIPAPTSLLGFVHIPKTAGSSMKFILRNSFGLRHCNLRAVAPNEEATDEDVEFARRVHWFGLRCISGHDLVGSCFALSTPADYFTFVRDPKSRCLSHFLHAKRAHRRKGKNLSVFQFLENRSRWNLQLAVIAGDQNLDRGKEALEQFLFVGLSEHFADSVVALKNLSAQPLDARYVRLHVTPNVEDKREVLADPVAMELLEEANQLDEELYAYVRDQLYPRFMKKAGVEPGSVDPVSLERESLTLRYWLNRWYQKGLYRPLVKRRRRRLLELAGQ